MYIFTFAQPHQIKLKCIFTKKNKKKLVVSATKSQSRWNGRSFY